MIEPAQGVAAALPERVRAEIGFGGCGGGFGQLGGFGLHLLAADGDRQVVMAEPALSSQGRLAAAGGGGDRLAPLVIGHIAGGKHPLLAGVGGAALGHQIPLGVELQLSFHQAGVGGVANGIKEALHRQGFAGVALAVLQLQLLQPLITAKAPHLAVPMHGDLRIGQDAIGHGPAGPQAVFAHDQVHMGAVFGEVDRFFASGIATAYNG